ncbi:tail fiber domain-containing protein [Dokdonia sp.]|uniref:tail fiber domain-containing protein n=1 Tax=Dokdonia sp. TaxID=2024995 RepID=UPI003265023F
MKNNIFKYALLLGFVSQPIIAQQNATTNAPIIPSPVVIQTNTNLGQGSGTNGTYNTNIGYLTGTTSTGSSNTFIGSIAGATNSTGKNNTFVGRSAGQLNTTGIGNVYLGLNAMFSNQGGHNNVAIGNKAGSDNNSGSRNVFLGSRSGSNNQGYGNIFLGNRSGEFELGNDKLYIDNTQTSEPLVYGDFATNLLAVNGSFFVNGNIQSNSGLSVNAQGAFLAIGPTSQTPGKWSFSTGSSPAPGPLPPPSQNIFMNVDQLTRNVGVGQNPGTEFAQLTVTSSGVPLAFENPSVANNAGGLWRFFQVGDHVGFDVNTGSTGSEFGSNYKRPLRMSDDGNVGRVGVGLPTVAPSYELDVNGIVRASSFISNSDRRFKQNIEPLENALEKINAMEGVSYQFKKSKINEYNLPSEQQYGLIAQDVQKIAPDIVQEDEQGYLGIDYIKIIPLLIESVKEQQASIVTLQEENAALKEAIDQLTGGNTTSKKEKSEAKLYQNTPNPLVDQTTIRYSITKEDIAKNAHIEIYDFNGIVIKRFDNLKEGKNAIEVSSSLLTSRITFYRLIVQGEVVDTKKMLKR